jgi:hypothetical protein
MMLVMKVTLAVMLIVFVVALIRKARIASLWRMWFYKRGCQETFFSLRRKREWLPRCPAPLAITVRLGPGAAFVPLQRFHA